MTKGNNYPFGSTQGGRGANKQDYRFGFNGKENDGEWGTSLVQDYGFRLYNPGIGRFLSVDPISMQYPELTPYQFASNRVIDGIDLDGLEYISHDQMHLELALGFGYMANKAIEGTLNISVGAAEWIYFDKSQVRAIRNAAARQGEPIPEYIPDEQVLKDYKMRYRTGDGFVAELRGTTWEETKNNANSALDILPFAPGKNEVATFAKNFILINQVKETGKQVIRQIDDAAKYGKFNDDIDIGVKYFHGQNKIGWAEINKQGVLFMDFNIDVQGAGIGTAMFKDMLSLGDVTAVRGMWNEGYSVNFNLFMKIYDDTGDLQKAAFSTPTGKWAKENGFDSVRMLRHSFRYDGEYDSVTMEFFKKTE